MTMNFDQEIDLLAQQPVFSSLKKSKLKLLAFTSEWLTYMDGDILFHQGDPGDAAFLILSGEASIILSGPESEVVIATWGPGDLIGEIAALSDTSRTATVRAKGELGVLKIKRDVFQQLLLDAPRVALDVIRLLAKRLAIATEDLRKLQIAQSRPR